MLWGVPNNVFIVTYRNGIASDGTRYFFRSEEEGDVWNRDVLALKGSIAAINDVHRPIDGLTNARLDALLRWMREYDTFFATHDPQIPADIERAKESIVTGIHAAGHLVPGHPVRD
jgi:hypothetical protein